MINWMNIQIVIFFELSCILYIKIVKHTVYPYILLVSLLVKKSFSKEEGRRKKEEGRRKKEEGRRKKEEGRRKKGVLRWGF
jgi:hypothetical protein